ncbi:phosphotransferase [Virgibacillus sp. C22-A2]|uniref:Phosphotransferase n=1 Tax=Virgibacillus tibetensis TaxID=3042313 RepID=A0ABU6KA75_9BACI|nr:phosphotransferase [Virgibacillus sp. C22-A2]
MNVVNNVLRSYAIYPIDVEKITGKLYKVSDGNITYALKKSSLSMQNKYHFHSVYQQANNHNITSIVPVYLTQRGEIYEETEQGIFYLTPWINAEQSHSTKQPIVNFYQTIGRIHAETKRTKSISTNQMISDFHTYKSFCLASQNKLLEFVDLFERTRYMSPIELLVCTHFRDLELALRESIKRIDQFVDGQEEETAWNYSLCHGDLKFSHLINAETFYIINWEKASYGHAVTDLAGFFNCEAANFDFPANEIIELFEKYYDENELSNNELYLLSIHLLNPIDYLRIVQDYSKKSSEETMINQIIKLQHAYRKIRFGLQWSNYVETEHETISLEDLES